MKILILLILIPFQLKAQDSQISVASPSESTMSVKGMRSPFYNEKSELIAELIGGRAFLLSSDFVNIEHVRINLYNEKKEITQLYTPNCKARISVIDGRKQIVVESEEWVVLKNDNVEVIGRGFKFDTHNQYFEIRNDVKITTDFAVFKDSEEMF
tara:strand:- start:56 stop:520 length:465 start_codon:yes stop_codon:yes gene_type:complete